MKPDISEFLYGYAVTESLIWDTSLPIVSAPIFSSLIMEGRVDGYDVAIPFEGLILFLQFKLSHYMARNSTYESKMESGFCFVDGMQSFGVSDSGGILNA